MAQFESQAYDVLLRDCGFPACHGATDRFFRVFGPGRTRIPTAGPIDPGDPATPEEVESSYRRARSMIDVDHPKLSLLLRKPLASSAGGAGHKGVDVWDHDVYESVNDPNYQILRSWVFSTMGLTPDAGVGP